MEAIIIYNQEPTASVSTEKSQPNQNPLENENIIIN